MEAQFISLLVIIVLSAIGIAIYRPDIFPEWTGFGEYTYSAGTNTEVVPAKTLWDWLGLLIIPLVLGLGVFILNSSQRKNEQEIAEKTRKADLKIAEENRKADFGNC